MLRLIRSCFLLALAAAALLAQPATQTCDDGRVLAISPFNPNPCGAPAPATPAPQPNPAPTPQPTPPPAQTCDDGRVVRITPFNPTPCEVLPRVAPEATPDDFLLVFNGLPPATGLMIEDRLAKEVYEARYNRFVGTVPEPDGFETVAALYNRWGLGDPAFYRDRSGDRVRWPDAPFHPADAAVADALARPNAIIAAWQSQVILRGGALAELHPAVPSDLQAFNQERLASAASGSPSGGPRFLTFGGADAIAAVHEDGPELVGAADLLDGVLIAPAQPGEFIRLFLTGLQGVEQLSVSVGGMELAPEDFAFSEVAPNRGGVYALAIRIPPSAPAGDLPVAVTSAGVSTYPGPFVTVARF